ncbi:MAG: hypothetical protein JOZ73_06165, partial [Solirubrobacterales bacterium]|nr:hypothetical protein [Solirubrobacterales bacterium]
MTISDAHDGGTDPIRARRLAVVSAGTNDPSSTHMLAGRISERSLEFLGQLGCSAS